MKIFQLLILGTLFVQAEALKPGEKIPQYLIANNIETADILKCSTAYDLENHDLSNIIEMKVTDNGNQIDNFTYIEQYKGKAVYKDMTTSIERRLIIKNISKNTEMTITRLIIGEQGRRPIVYFCNTLRNNEEFQKWFVK